MKKLFLLLLVTAGILVSCENEDIPKIEYGEAKMLSFGFYTEDNEGVIVQDYVVSEISSNNITILLPEDVDKSKLIARFTTSEKDTVKVSGTIQVSGVTANNFTVPVDYFVSEGTNNAKYTITIGNAPAFVWSVLPPVAGNDSAVNSDMKVNPVDGLPYIIYKVDRELSDDEKAAMFKLEDGAWKSLGEISEGRVSSDLGLTFNSAGVPYVSYMDYTNEIAQTASVKKYNGTGWELVGNKGFTTAKITYSSLAFANDNKLMFFGTYDSKDGTLARRELSVSSFENGVWATNATIPGRPSDLVAYAQSSVRFNNAIYLVILNAVSPNSFSVYKYENNTWTTLMDKWVDPNATGMSIIDIDIDLDKDGNVYVAFADNSSEATLKNRVIKYEVDTKEISNVGNFIPGVSGSKYYFDLSISPLGVPYLFYRNESGFPTITNIDKDTQDWTAPNILANVDADDLSFDFAPNGEAYIAFTVNNKFFTYKYAAPAN